jgi:hypothetical protein
MEEKIHFYLLQLLVTMFLFIIASLYLFPGKVINESYYLIINLKCPLASPVAMKEALFVLPVFKGPVI